MKNITKLFFSLILFCSFVFPTIVSADYCLTSTGDVSLKHRKYECEKTNGTWKLGDPPAVDGTTSNSGEAKSVTGFDTSSIGTYIKSIYTYAIGIVGIIATIVIMGAGFIWITSMGNASRVSNAKEWIGAALTGLALALFSYTILWIINPDLVSFQAVDPKSAESQIEIYHPDIDYNYSCTDRSDCPDSDYLCEDSICKRKFIYTTTPDGTPANDTSCIAACIKQGYKGGKLAEVDVCKCFLK